MTTPYSTFPETPTLHARVHQTGWVDYEATLTLPGGQQQTLTGAELDDTRGQVINAAREYLHTHVGHPGRLRVEDPDGNWLLGVPPDDSDLVHLSGTATPAPAPTPVPPRATPVVLPARPSVTRRRGGPSRSAGRRIAATGALVLALLVVAGIGEAVHGSSPKPPAHRVAATRRTTPTVSVATPAVTGSVSTSVTTPVAHHRPRPTPRHPSRPRHRPRHAAHVARHAAHVARHAAHVARHAAHAAAPAQTPTAHRAATHPSPPPHQAPAPAVLQPRSPAAPTAAPQPTPQPSPAPTPQPAPTPAPACYPGVLGC